MQDMSKKILNLIKEALITETNNCSYAHQNITNPYLSQLGITELQDLIIKLTQIDVSFRADPNFRQKILNELIPLLPKVLDITELEAKFLYRLSKKRDERIKNKYKVGEDYIIDNYFTSFSLNRQGTLGLDCGQTVFVSSNFKNSFYLGPLSQVNTEKEVLVPQGTSFKILGIYQSLEEILKNGKDYLNPDLISLLEKTTFRSKHEHVILG